mgnify:FL=1
MDAADSWRAFACTGSIKDYLEYKRQQDTGPVAVIGEKTDGRLCDAGSCAERDSL